MRILFAALMLFASITMASAQHKPKTDTGIMPEFGILQEDMVVTNLEKGGKRMAIEKGEILPEGASCKLSLGDVVSRIGEEGDKVLVRTAKIIQLKKGYCPRRTPVHITKQQWEKARAAYLKWWEWTNKFKKN